MNGLINYDETTKKITISANSKCEWSCVITDGNITLSQTYGKLDADNSYCNSGITIYTYNTDDMYGDITCRFQNNNGWMVKKKLTIHSTPLHVFYVPTKSITLFGEGTKSYIYVYYGTLNQNDPNVLDTLSIIIDNTTFIYDGGYNNHIINVDNVSLYKIETQEYNDTMKYFEIVITSLTDYVFNDIIIIKGQNNNQYEEQFIISLQQSIVENVPTVLKISPSFAFLNNKHPKQKINVTSIYKGVPRQYIISDTKPTENNISPLTNDIEDYLNSTSITPLRDDNLDISKLVNEKNASHFILDMSGYAENADNVGNENDNENIAYELYVIQSGNTSCWEKLEFFYDYVFDPNDYIKISKIKSIYGYAVRNKDKNLVEFVKVSDENNFIDGDMLSYPITIYFTKDKKEMPPILDDRYEGYVFAQYSPNSNVECVVESMPVGWRIYSVSDYVKEVKLSDTLQISLEATIPFEEETSISLQNEMGSVCTIFCKSAGDIFEINNTCFNFDNKLTSIDITLTNSGQSCVLCSQTNDEQWYYFIQEFTVESNATFLNVNTIWYQKDKNNNKVNEYLKPYNFPILFNSDINKFYIMYGSITTKPNEEVEIKDVNNYYFNNFHNTLTIQIPIPEKSKYVPWTIINNGCGIQYDAYEAINENGAYEWKKITDKEPTYKPQSSGTTIYCFEELPIFENKYLNSIILKPINLISDLTIKSPIIFQQMNSMSEATLYITSQQQNGVYENINKFGSTASLNSMLNISSLTIFDAYTGKSSNKIIKNINGNDVAKLYYASYKKDNAFLTKENTNVKLSIVEEGKMELENLTDLNNLNYLNASLFTNTLNYKLNLSNTSYAFRVWNYMSGYNTNNDNQNNQLDNSNDIIGGVDNEFNIWDDKITGTLTGGTLTGTSSGITSAITSGNTTPPQFVEFWEIKDGIIYIYDTEEDFYNKNVKEQFFPEEDMHIQDENMGKGDMFTLSMKKIGLLLQENSTVLPKKIFCVVFKNYNKLTINGNIYDIYNTTSSITYNCLYELLHKTVEFGDNNIYVFDKQNILFYVDNDGNINNSTAYKNGDQWYVNLPSVTFTILYNDENNYFYIPYKNETTPYLPLTNNLEVIIDGIQYSPTIQINLLGLCLEVLTNIDGEEEKYIIINNNKYVANNDKISLNYDYHLSIQTSDSGDTPIQYIIFDKDFFVNAINEPSYEYIIVDNVEYELTVDGYVIYDGQRYDKVKQNQESFIVINYKGYKVLQKDANYYIILNYLKNYYKILDNNIKYDNLSGETKDLFIEEIANENFTYNLDFNNLLDNNIINGKYEDCTLSNGNITIDNNDLFLNDEPLLIKKDISLNTENYPFTIISNEIVEPSLKSDNVTSKTKLIFNDETQIIYENGNESFFETNSTLDIKNASFSSFTINDYSNITFSGSCFITFHNDCNIEINDVTNKNEHIIKNETLYINGVIDLIFKDVIKITIYTTHPKLFVFNNVIKYKDNIYIGSIINNQNAVTINDNVYYIYDNKIIIDDGEIECFERAILYKKINKESGITPIVYKVDNFLTDTQEPTYKIYSNKEIQDVINKNDIKYYITIPYFNKDKNKWECETKELTNIKIFKTNDNTTSFNYSKAILSGHSNLGDITIENGILSFNINCYKINDDSNKNVGYTSSQENYEFTIDGVRYSIWDYLTNNYVKKIKQYDKKENIELLSIKKMTLKNIKYEVDENKYIQIDDKILPIYSVVKNDVTTLNYVNDKCELVLKHFQYNNLNEAEIVDKTYIITRQKNNDILNKEEYNYFIDTEYKIIVKGDENFNTNIQLQSYIFESIDEQTTYQLNENRGIVMLYDEKLYHINDKMVTIPKLCPIYKNENQCLVEFDINAYLTFNFNFNKLNSKQGVINTFTVENALSITHNENIMIKVEESDNILYGFYKLYFYS